jgi:hypothetical protein
MEDFFMLPGSSEPFEQSNSLAELDRVQSAAKLVLQIAKHSAQLAQTTKRVVGRRPIDR